MKYNITIDDIAISYILYMMCMIVYVLYKHVMTSFSSVEK